MFKIGQPVVIKNTKSKFDDSKGEVIGKFGNDYVVGKLQHTTYIGAVVLKQNQIEAVHTPHWE